MYSFIMPFVLFKLWSLLSLYEAFMAFIIIAYIYDYFDQISLNVKYNRVM